MADINPNASPKGATPTNLKTGMHAPVTPSPARGAKSHSSAQPSGRTGKGKMGNSGPGGPGRR